MERDSALRSGPASLVEVRGQGRWLAGRRGHPPGRRDILHDAGPPSSVRLLEDGVRLAPSGVRLLEDDVRPAPSSVCLLEDGARPAPSSVRLLEDDARLAPSSVRLLEDDVRPVGAGEAQLVEEARGAPLEGAVALAAGLEPFHAHPPDLSLSV